MEWTKEELRKETLRRVKTFPTLLVPDFQSSEREENFGYHIAQIGTCHHKEIYDEAWSYYLYLEQERMWFRG